MTGFSGGFQQQPLRVQKAASFQKTACNEKCGKPHYGRDGRKEDKNADLTLEANQKTLTRDYRGMMLYSLLWRQGMITRPDVSDQMQTVTGDGKKLVTGDRVRRLKNHAEFNLQKSHWRPLIGTEGGSR
ncbi:TraI protein [Salmonella enterica subsp. enterica serovar Virchow str. ATCC 51955]|nr:TraI protein [Salmonella enterica subsp. enterica serovar Virchow str. ATCC 51955]